MKQTISTDQLMELTEEQFEALFKLINWKPIAWFGKSTLESNGCISDVLCHILSIGQMIEILDNKQLNMQQCGGKWEVIYNIYGKIYRSNELSDALWSAIKSIL